MKLIRILTLMALMLCGGSAYSEDLVELETRFDMDEVSWILVEGDSSIGGQAFLNMPNGDVKGCAGFNVELLPVADYANERILKTYGNNTSGQILLRDSPPKFTPDAEGYHEMGIKGQCNQENDFLFEGINAGEYYVIAFIIWDHQDGDAPAEKDGGGVMKRVSVARGEHKTVLMKN